MSSGVYQQYGGINMINSLQSQIADKKGKMRAEDFDVAFAQAAASYQTESSKIEEVQDVADALSNVTIEDNSKQTAPVSEDFKT